MLLINAVNAEGRPVELYAKDGKSPPSVRDWPRWPERTRRCWTPGG